MEPQRPRPPPPPAHPRLHPGTARPRHRPHHRHRDAHPRRRPRWHLPPQPRAVLPVDVDCIGHNDLGPYNVVHGGAAGTEVTALIDWDFAGPSNRVWDVSYAAHRFVPLSAPRSARAFGFDPVPDQRARLRTLLDAYGDDVDAGYLLDVLLLRLAAITAHVERGVLAGDPRFTRQHRERHTDGYREDTAHVLRQRSWPTS